MKLEPGMVQQVANLVNTWDVEVLDAITGHLTTGECDLLARVYGAHGGMEAALPVMVSFMTKTMEDSANRADWAGDAQRVRDLGWLDDAEAWDEAAGIWAGDVAPHSLMIELAEYGDQLDEEYRVSLIRGV